MPVLTVEKLAKDFGGVRSLDGVSFSVYRGERLAIIGPNGAGKTTLFNCLNGQLKPTSGRIFFLDKEITHMSTHKRTHLGQARSFQVANLFFNLTILDNIFLSLHGTQHTRFQLYRASKSYKNLQVTAEKLLAPINLWAKKDELVQSISYGEQRKLEIALSLTSEPKLLLLDEPSCGLTMTESNDVVNIIRDLRSDITVILIAHDMDLVFGIATRIIVLQTGQIIADGTPQEIKDNPMVKEIYIGTGEGSSNV
jgi:branched-chain amino acid transport system ATP-binding protein